MIESKSMIPFKQATYLSQLRRLRELAKLALSQYPIGKYQLEFINHGENTTYKVKTARKNYLLRIHRNGYHSKSGLLEELKWLNKLNTKTDISLQKPILTKNQQLLSKAFLDKIGEPRFCSLMTWQDGAIKYKKSNQNFYDIGLLIAKLQSVPLKIKHRIYWNTEGLVGRNAVLGPLKHIKDDFPKEFKAIEPYRQLACRKLRAYEKRSPKKLSIIHGDLHFGNMIWNGNRVSPIDFDDCGFGFHMYDLAVTMFNSGNHFDRIGKKKAAEAREALLNGYNQVSNTTDDDLRALPYLMLAREIAMIGWLYERRDNPYLLDHLRKNLKEKIRRIKNHESYMR